MAKMEKYFRVKNKYKMLKLNKKRREDSLARRRAAIAAQRDN